MRHETLTHQQREQRIKNGRRMIGVFGQREMEIAAIAILDSQWDRPFDALQPANLDRDVFEGILELRRHGWLEEGARGLVPTRAFWLRVHGR